MRRAARLVIILLVLMAVIGPLVGCRSVYAQGAYERLGYTGIEQLDEPVQREIRAAASLPDGDDAKVAALWWIARRFEQAGDYHAALVAYKTIRTTEGRRPGDLDRRIRSCRAQVVVARRWTDARLREAAREMDTERGLGLYREVVATLTRNYVDEVGCRAIVGFGLDNLEAAMTSGAFLEQWNLADRTADVAVFRGALDQLRRDLDEREQVTCFTARYLVRQALEANADTTALPPGVVLSEFIFGAAEHLDPYTSYLTHAMYEATLEDIRGRFVGIGVEVRRTDGRLNVVHVFDGGPAEDAGIRPGDEIVRVDGHDVTGEEIDRAVTLLRGERGADVRVTVDRGGEMQTLAVTRDAVSVPSVRRSARVGPDGAYGYVLVTGFQNSTAAEIDRALAELSSGAPLRGIVLDLRNNPGGLFRAAVETASLFIDRGVVVETRGRGIGQSRVHRVSPWDSGRYGQPIAVLVNGSSASSSEIVAAALRAHDRAILVGERTFGKGVVQSVLPVEAGRSAVYLTAARFYGPEGTCLHGEGLAADIEVDSANVEPSASERPDAADDPVLARAIQALEAGDAPAGDTGDTAAHAFDRSLPATAVASGMR